MNSILDYLDTIKKAQTCDSRLYSIQLDLKEIPQKKQELKAELQSHQASLQSLEQSVKDLLLKQKNKEGELAQKETEIKKFDGQLAQVKTNKEYGMIKQEIASLQADNSLIEDEIIKLMDAVEAASRELKTEKIRLEQVAKEFQIKEREIADQENAFKVEIDSLKKEREGLVAGLPSATALMYSQISNHKQGIVLSPIQAGVCGACKISLRAQVINEVQIGQKVVTCDNCSRILYIEKA
jgi:uncharacterized protein